MTKKERCTSLSICLSRKPSRKSEGRAQNACFNFLYIAGSIFRSYKFSASYAPDPLRNACRSSCKVCFIFVRFYINFPISDFMKMHIAILGLFHAYSQTGGANVTGTPHLKMGPWWWKGRNHCTVMLTVGT
jgi:hypothetical protein